MGEKCQSFQKQKSPTNPNRRKEQIKGNVLKQVFLHMISDNYYKRLLKIKEFVHTAQYHTRKCASSCLFNLRLSLLLLITVILLTFFFIFFILLSYNPFLLSPESLPCHLPTPPDPLFLLSLQKRSDLPNTVYQVVIILETFPHDWKRQSSRRKIVPHAG